MAAAPASSVAMMTVFVFIVHFLILYALVFQRDEEQVELGGVAFRIGFVTVQPPEE